jgi:2-keto-4-pentenoate hydratase/2-oxohepta-3-ene-1,7-dioic acid hydratase in catechol pathway
MKLATFEQNGRQSYGVVDSEKIIDMGPSIGGQYPDLRSILAADALGAVIDAQEAGGSGEYALDDVRLLPPIGNPDKIICVGLNYESHRKETGRPVVEYPTLFTRFANTQIGHGAPIHAPKESTSVDYEGELAVIIGKPGRHIAESEAMEHVAGYSCYNDVSIRDWQRHTSQFTPGKNFAATGPFGPWMVTSDEIPDPSTLTLETRLNGERMQHATTDLLIFTIPVLIKYISTFTRLEPGDVIVSGTPGGVGFKRDPQVFMKNGDQVEIEISGIGVLANPVINAPD